MKWYTRSCERPRKRSASVALPWSVSNRYSLSTRTHGSSCRRRAISSLRRVSSFSASSSSSRAASHSLRVPVMCFVIALSPFGCASWFVRFRRSRRGTRQHRSGHCGELSFRGLRGGLELPAELRGVRVREDVLLPCLDAVEDRERHFTRRGLRQRDLAGHVGVDRARVDAE